MIKLALLFTFSLKLQASNEVVYGKDDRLDYYQSKPVIQELSAATAVMINNIRLKPSADKYKISKKTLEDYGVCSEERFAQQPIAGSCTGFLIAPDTLVTAGHCIQTIDDCKIHRWLFNYKVEKEGVFNFTVPAKDVYHCVELIKRGYDHGKAIDFAIVRLDRTNSEVQPLTLRTKGKIQRNDRIFVIGHPTGLPMKYAGNAIVRSTSSHSFLTNLDTFAGNSGSPVFNEKTLEVEGILIRGETDYVKDPARGCKKVNFCRADACEGETVSSISVLNTNLN